MSETRPWFKFWANDFLSDMDCTLLSLEQVGVLVRLWAFAWKQGFIPASVEQCAVLAGAGRDTELVRPVVEKFFRPHPDNDQWLISPRMEHERDQAIGLSKTRAELGKRGAEAKAKAKAGAIAGANALAKPQQSESESESDTTTKARKTRKKSAAVGFLPEAIELMTLAKGKWPTTDPLDGREIKVDARLTAQRIEELLLAGNSPDSIRYAIDSYVTESRNRYRAPQFFFGPGGPGETSPSLPYLKAYHTERAMGGATHG